MLKSEKNQDKSANETTKHFLTAFVVLLAAVLVFHGKTVPYSNELVYLLRLEPQFLPNDWTFSVPANEHWLFNFLFSFPARFFSLEILAWLGRFFVWGLSLIALLRIGKCWEISLWAISVSIFIWLAFGQSIVGEEWIFGGFEAKTVAYVCLLFALDGFSKQKTVLPAILLGLVFSFHPAVGLWAILAVGSTLLFQRIAFRELLKVVGLTFVFALPGIIAALAEQEGATLDSVADWRFIVTVRAPTILDPFQFPRTDNLLLLAMLVFNVFALRAGTGFAVRFLLKFQIATGAFFLFGFLLRAFELFPLLRLMPMRLFPVLTTLFFIFSVFYILSRLTDTKYKMLVCLIAALAAVWINPIFRGAAQLRETIQSQTIAPDDLQKTLAWVAENTSLDSVIIAPPNRRDIWYFSRRATIASFAYPTYDRLGEWRKRVADLTGNLQISGGEQTGEEIEAAFNKLSGAQIIEIKRKYGGDVLVSRAVYSYPIIFETETYKVYQLP